MRIPPEAWQVITAVVAAMLAGLFSFIVTILTKEQKTSEFRQAWIDALRNDISEFASILITMADTMQLKSAQGQTDHEVSEHLLTKRFTEIKQMEGLRVRVLLRLNPKEHKEFIALIEQAYVYCSTLRERHEDGSSLIATFVTQSQNLLKKEWRRVKRGELSFFITKWVSFAVFLVGLIVAIGFASGHLRIS